MKFTLASLGLLLAFSAGQAADWTATEGKLPAFPGADGFG